jgi:hypothetical protein
VSTHILQAPVFLVVDAARVSDIRACGCRAYDIPRVYMSVAVVPPSQGSSSTQLCRHGSPSVCGIGHVEDAIVLLEYISMCAIRVHSYAAVVCTCDCCIPVLELQPAIITNNP